MSGDLRRYEIQDPFQALVAIGELLDGSWSGNPEHGHFVVESFCYAVACLKLHNHHPGPRLQESFKEVYPFLEAPIRNSAVVDPHNVLVLIAERLDGVWSQHEVGADNYAVDAFLIATGTLTQNHRIAQGSRLATSMRATLSAINAKRVVSVGYALAAGSGYEVTAYDAEMQPLSVREYGNSRISDDPVNNVSPEDALSADSLREEALKAAQSLAAESGLPPTVVFYDTDRANDIAEDRGHAIAVGPTP